MADMPWNIAPIVREWGDFWICRERKELWLRPEWRVRIVLSPPAVCWAGGFSRSSQKWQLSLGGRVPVERLPGPPVETLLDLVRAVSVVGGGVKALPGVLA